MIEVINNIVVSNYAQFMKKVVCSTDEIIYEIDKSYDISDFINSIKQIDPSESVYRVEKFNLLQLCPYNYFVKIIQANTNIDDIKLFNTKYQFKLMPKRHLIQCIKHCESETNITELDKKITFEDEDVTQDNQLVFSAL